MRKLVCVAALLIASASLAHADVVAERQALMKGIGNSVKAIAPMVKGEKPFDAGQASDALSKLNEYAQKINVEALFPKGSDTGDTTASPKVWEDMTGFKAKADKFKADVATAVAANPHDLDDLKTQFQAVSSNCRGCHQDFRIKKN